MEAGLSAVPARRKSAHIEPFNVRTKFQNDRKTKGHPFAIEHKEKYEMIARLFNSRSKKGSCFFATFAAALNCEDKMYIL